MKEFPEIPGYDIKKSLGRGGMAEVFLAVQKKLSRLVAIKVFVPDRFTSTRLVKRFEKEAKIASRLVHPHIITVYDVGRIEDGYYMAMEYLPESLKDRIRKQGRLDPQEALKILLQIAAALYYAHLKGFIHRDIKPENIMFRKDNTPVIVDFGIARAIESASRLTQTGFSPGTPQYMSPEQCRARKLDGRSDIYSLGVVLYEMLTGDVPYKGGDLRLVVLKHLQDSVPRLPWTLAPFQPLLDRMMAKERRHRPASEGELRQLVQPVLNPLTQRSTGRAKPARSGEGEKTLTAVPETQKGTLKIKAAAAANKRTGKPKRRFYWIVFIILALVLLFLLLMRFLSLDLGKLIRL